MNYCIKLFDFRFNHICHPIFKFCFSILSVDGKTTVGDSYALGRVADTSKKVFLVVTTQPLINGTTIDLTHRSRYVILSAKDDSYTFYYMHPGTYYLYALYDADGNGTFNAGDWMNFPAGTFTLSSLGTTTVSAQINFTIP